MVFSLEDAELTRPYDEDGSVTVRLPRGRYLIDSMIYTDGGNHGNLIVQPGVLLDRDQTFNLNPAMAKPVRVTPPATAALGWADISYLVESDKAIVGGGFATNADLSVLSTAQLGDPLPNMEMNSWVSTHWLGTAAEHFALVWYFDRFPTGYDKAVSWRELATLRRKIGPGVAGDKGVPYLVSQPLSGAVRSGSGYQVELPTTQTAYVTTGNVRWQTQLWIVTDFFPLAEVTSPWRTYRAGRTYSEEFNQPVFGPGLPPGGNTFGNPWVGRMEDLVAVNVPLYTDRAGNAGTTYEESGSTKLYLGDQLVGESKSGGSGYFAGLPAESGNYRLTTESVNPVRFAPTTSVSAEWTFRSSYVDRMTAVDLNVVRFLPKLAEDGSAPAGRSFVVPLKFQDEKGAYCQPRKLTVEVSYDEGKTWQRVPVTSKLEAKLKHPAGATSVSFRASATDRDGNTVKQTIIRAYTLR
jgi:hypothetical protein